MGEMRHQGGPLSGIKVVDLTSLRSSAAQLLSSLGADVIKIESLEGDDLRKVGPTKNPGMGHIFTYQSRQTQCSCGHQVCAWHQGRS